MLKNHSKTFVVCIALTVFVFTSTAFAQNKGIQGRKAPEFKVDEWVQLPRTPEALKTKKVKINDYKGKVVYMFFFQAHCPSCRQLGFPAIRDLKAKYAKDKDVAFVAIQTANGGSSIDNPKRAKELARQYRLDNIAIGHSTSSKANSVFKSYKPGGTPWVVLVDKQGVVRYNDYFLDPSVATAKIDALKRQ